MYYFIIGVSIASMIGIFYAGFRLVSYDCMEKEPVQKTANEEYDGAKYRVFITYNQGGTKTYEYRRDCWESGQPLEILNRQKKQKIIASYAITEPTVIRKANRA